MVGEQLTRFEQAKALRRHPLVLSWIESYRKVTGCRYPDCRHCDYPHSPVFLCGSAVFGELRIGADTYHVNHGNVNFFVSFREATRPGFHWRNDIYFERTTDHVEVTSFWKFNNCPQERRWRIPLAEWDSIVAAMAGPSPLPTGGSGA